MRVDFNGVLTEEAFLDFGQRLRAGGLAESVDFIEDPMPYDAASWNRLRLATGLRLALDRLSGTEEGGFDIRVLKPAVDAMDPHPVPVVVTSYMDHPLGQAWAAWESQAANTSCRRLSTSPCRVPSPQMHSLPLG